MKLDAARTMGLFFAYIASIAVGVWAIDYFGIVSVGFGQHAPAAVYVVGVTLVLRDLLQDAGGRGMTIVAIAMGAAVSAMINPGLALASGVAFLISELLDLLVYTPMRKRGRTVGVLTSNAVSIPVDSLIFLSLAFGSLQFFWGQVIGKSIATMAAVALLIVMAMAKAMPKRERVAA